MSSVTFKIGDHIVTQWRPGRTLKVNARLYEATTRMRSALIVAAKRRSTLTYGELAAAIDQLYTKRNLSRPLDLLAHDCIQRGEPSLASLVVTKAGGEVSTGFVGKAGPERERCYEHHR
ncbi:hypothetical protein V6U90_07910 [Micromonospora sp. CPCC 206060]|uniref:hypothetical protein n=1 Tax=Micromonospora sp. CPCC 206060 TaxID=3122406 RepID=UPI002FF0AB01